jgi:hypothetical protein
MAAVAYSNHVEAAVVVVVVVPNSAVDMVIELSTVVVVATNSPVAFAVDTCHAVVVVVAVEEWHVVAGRDNRYRMSAVTQANVVMMLSVAMYCLLAVDA